MSASAEFIQYQAMKSQQCSGVYKCFRGSYSKEWYGASLSGNNPLRINEMCADVLFQCTPCFKLECVMTQWRVFVAQSANYS